MAEAVLFTQLDPQMGPAATNLFRVKGMTEVVLKASSTEWRYPRGTVRPVSGADTEMLLYRVGRVPLNLAAVPGAVAAVVIDGEDGWLCWFDDDECLLAEPCRTMALAWSEVEAHCCPTNGYEL
jgi:hypothetical protein